MTEPIHIRIDLQVNVYPAEADTILKEAAAAGIDYGDNLLTLDKAVAVLVNVGNYNFFSEWSAGPLWDETTLEDLAIRRLTEHGLNLRAISNGHGDTESPSFPFDRYFAVERTDDGRVWAFAGATLAELADLMDQSEVNISRILFVTDLVTGIDLDAGIKLSLP